MWNKKTQTSFAVLKGPLQCSGIGTALRPLWTSEADLSLDKVKRLEIMGGGGGSL